MSLRIKTFLVLVATLIGVLVVFQASFRVYLVTLVRRQEAEFLQHDLQRALSILEENLATLDGSLSDFTAWDDTYAFVSGKNPTFLQANLPAQAYRQLRLNMVVILGTEGNILYRQGFDLARGTLQPLPTSLQDYLRPGSALLAPERLQTGFRTILALPEGALMVVARPVLRSDGEGPARGTMLMGRFLDAEDLARLKQMTLMDISLYSAVETTPPAARPQWQALAGGAFAPAARWLLTSPPQVQVIDERTSAIYTLVRGVLPQPLLLEIRSPRTIYQQNLALRRQVFVAMLLVGWVLLTVTYLMLDRLALRGLYRLIEDVYAITRRGDAGARVPEGKARPGLTGLPGNEVAALAASVNEMLGALETGQQRRIEDEQRYRAVVEQAFEGIFLIDAISLEVIEANPAFQAFLGYTLEELRGMTLFELSGHQRSAILMDVREVIERGYTEVGERMYVRKDGGQVIAEVSGSLVHFGDRQVVCSLVRDVTERKRENHATEVLNQIAQMAASDMDFMATLQLLVDRLGSLLNSDGCYITLWDEALALARPVAAYGPERETYPQSQGKSGELSLTASVMRSGRTLVINDVMHSPYIAPDIAAESDTMALLGLPLVAGQEKIGALLVSYSHRHHFTPEEIDRAERAAGPTALAIAKAQLFEDLKHSHTRLTEAYDITLEGWARALELRDQETEGHTRRVTALTLRLGQAMGLAGEELVILQRGALLHDIGKMGVPDSILLKPGPLTAEETEVMRRHPEYAYTMLAPIEYLRPALEIPYRHHEKWDGSGYPRGLHGCNIPLAARIFAVVDVWDALTSDRPYRKAWRPEAALAYIREQSGRHFDPCVVAAFLDVIQTVYSARFEPAAEEFTMGD